MWVVFVVLVVSTALSAQTAQTYTYDVNGNRVRGPEIAAGKGERTERFQSINGRTVPVEQVEERVLRSDSSGKVTERIIRRYTPDGAPASTERVLLEEETRADGGSTVRTSVYQSTASGGSKLVERTTAEVRKAGDATTTSTVLERPGLDGSLAAAERRTVTESKSGNTANQSTVVYAPDTNGRFQEITRETVDRRVAGAQSTESTERYTPGPSGELVLTEVRRSRSVKQPDGSESVVVDVYGPSTPGVVNAAGGGPKIREQQVIERRRTDGGSVETVAIRRPSVSNPNRLGPARPVSETVCKGQCP